MGEEEEFVNTHGKPGRTCQLQLADDSDKDTGIQMFNELKEIKIKRLLFIMQ